MAHPSSQPRLGLLGTFGFFAFWLVSTYLVLAVLGYGFYDDLPVLTPRSPIGGLLPTFGGRSSLRADINQLRTTGTDLAHLAEAIDFATTDGIATATLPGGLYLGLARAIDANLATSSRDFRGFQPTQLRIWKSWLAGGDPILPIPDPYGFPLLPAASPQTLEQFFPDLMRERRTTSSDEYPTTWNQEHRIRGLFLAEGDRSFSFPFAWRHQEVIREFKVKQRGLRIYLFLSLVGLVVSVMLFFRPMPDFGEIQFLKAFGVLFGFLSLSSMAVLRMCYRPSLRSDAERIAPSTIDQIKRDCQRYLEALEKENKLTADQRRQLSALIERQ